MNIRAELNEKCAEQNRLASEIAAARQRAADLRNRAAAADTRASAEAAAEVNADAIALSSGKRPGTRKGDAGASARREVAAAHRAAEMVEAEISTLEQAFAGAECETVDAALTVFRAEREAAHLEVLAAVDVLGLALARILATGFSCDALTGQRYSFDPARHPPATLWQPHPLVSALVSAMPPRFQPEGWAEDIERGAYEIAESALQAKGTSK